VKVLEMVETSLICSINDIRRNNADLQRTLGRITERKCADCVPKSVISAAETFADSTEKLA
jgi:hypothetical protein